MGNDNSCIQEKKHSTISTPDPIKTDVFNLNHDKTHSTDLEHQDSNHSNQLFPPHHSTLRSTNLSFMSHASESSATSSLDIIAPLKLTDAPSASLTPMPSILQLGPMQLKKAKSLDRKRASSILVAHNGVTDKYISSRICKIAAIFWQKNIEPLSTADQLEIGCSIFFSMLSANDEMKSVMKSNFVHEQKIENASLRYLDMMGWLIRYLVMDNVNLPSLLSRLGVLHKKMGINIQHFDPMLVALHDTFSYYFDQKYSIEIKYAMDEIFSMAAQMMTGTELKFSSHLMDITKQFQGSDIPFLKSLKACLASNIGKEYLNRYMSQTLCEEIPIFLQSLHKFKSRTTDKERFMIAKDIIKISINADALFALNISYDTRVETINSVNALNAKFTRKEEIEISTEFFSEVERKIYRLIQQNHWRKFVEQIQELQSKSFNID